MKYFAVYQNPLTNEMKAVKIGFSWPGFFFTWLWAFIKELWEFGAAILLALMFANYVLISGNHEASIGVFPLTLVLNVMLGLKGNELVRKRLEKKGWRHLGNVMATGPEHAIMICTGKAPQIGGLQAN